MLKHFQVEVAILSLLEAPLRGVTVASVSQSTRLARQVLSSVFELAPVWLVIYLVRRNGEGLGSIGLAWDRPRRDIARGALLFAIVGLAGIGVYLGAVALGVNRFVVPVPPLGHWWTVPVLLLTTYRPGYNPPWLGKSYVTQIALRPLSREAGEQIVAAILGDGNDATERIVARGEGNPFFLEELGRAARQQGDGSSDGSVPTTVQDVLAARIDQLDAGDKSAVQVASVLGREFSLEGMLDSFTHRKNVTVNLTTPSH